MFHKGVEVFAVNCAFLHAERVTHITDGVVYGILTEADVIGAGNDKMHGIADFPISCGRKCNNMAAYIGNVFHNPLFFQHIQCFADRGIADIQRCSKCINIDFFPQAVFLPEDHFTNNFINLIFDGSFVRLFYRHFIKASFLL